MADAIVFLLFVGLVVFGAARLGWAAAASWYRSGQARIDELVDDVLGER